MNNAMKPLPFLLCGKAPGHIRAVTNIVRPEFEVVSVASSFEDAEKSVNELLDGSLKVSFVVMGGGFPNDFFEPLRGKTDLPWLRPVFTSPNYDGPPLSQPPSDQEIASRLRKALDEHVDEIREGKSKTAVWYF